VKITTIAGATVVIVLAMLRQSLSLQEYDRLIAAKQHLRKRTRELEGSKVRLGATNERLLTATREAEALAESAQVANQAKSEAAKLEFDVTRVDLRELIEEVVRLIGIQAHPKNLEVTAYIDAAIPDFIQVDAGRLRQILLNLFGNAVKFTQAAEIALSVQPIARDAESTTLRFDLRDRHPRSANDAEIAPGRGFDLRGHVNMEIISYTPSTAYLCRSLPRTSPAGCEWRSKSNPAFAISMGLRCTMSRRCLSAESRTRGY
jgi:signal transduction histidine kinase